MDKVDPVDDAAPDVAAIVRELQERIAARERAGDRPPDLESDLDAHFTRLSRTAPEVDLRPVQELIDELRSARDELVSPPSPDGGPADKLRSGAARVRTRLVEGTSAGLIDLAIDTLEEMATRLAEAEVVRAGVEDRLAHVEHLIDGLRRDAGDDPGSLSALRQRVGAIEEGLPATFDPPFTAAEFQRRFRGSEVEGLDDWTRSVVDRLQRVDGPVLDIGCGTGELLAALSHTDVDARGVDLDPGVTADCRAAGLNARTGDGILALQHEFDASLGAVVALQVIEHLDEGRLVELVRVAHRKLKAGGLLVLQTVNVESLHALARAYVIDPTHVKPVHHLYLEFLVESAGFDPVSVEFSSVIPDHARLTSVETGNDRVDAALATNHELLNRVLFAPQDYAVVGER